MKYLPKKPKQVKKPRGRILIQKLRSRVRRIITRSYGLRNVVDSVLLRKKHKSKTRFRNFFSRRPNSIRKGYKQARRGINKDAMDIFALSSANLERNFSKVVDIKTNLKNKKKYNTKWKDQSPSSRSAISTKASAVPSTFEEVECEAIRAIYVMGR